MKNLNKHKAEALTESNATIKQSEALDHGVNEQPSIFRRRAPLFIYILIFAILGVALLWRGFADTTLQTINAYTLPYPHPSSTQSTTPVDATATSGHALAMFWTGSVLFPINLSSDAVQINIHTRGDQCSGAPALLVQVDDKLVAGSLVTNTSWQTVAYKTLITKGPHAVRISFPNDTYYSSGCDRNLYLDTITLSGNAVPPPTINPPIEGIRTADSSFRLFAPDSPWNTPLPSNAPVDPTSAIRMANLVNVVNSDLRANGPGTYMSYGSPIYLVDSRTTQSVPVYITNPTQSWHTTLDALWKKGVPMPPNAQPNTGGDGHMTVYDTFTDTLYEFFQTCPPTTTSRTAVNGVQRCPQPSSPAVPAGAWQAAFGGVLQNVSKNPGYFQNVCSVKGTITTNPASFPAVCDAGSIIQQPNWGATASSLPVAAGVATVAELKAGQINHALALNLPAFPKNGSGDMLCNASITKSPTPYVFPAQRSDGTSVSSNCIPEGALLRLDPSVNLNNYSFSRIGKMMAVAAQKYGMIVRDRTAYEPSFFFEDPITYQLTGSTTDPYSGNPFGSSAPLSPTGLMGGVPAYAQFRNTTYNGVKYDGFPWDKVNIETMRVCSHGSPCTLTNSTTLP